MAFRHHACIYPDVHGQQPYRHQLPHPTIAGNARPGMRAQLLGNYHLAAPPTADAACREKSDAILHRIFAKTPTIGSERAATSRQAPVISRHYPCQRRGSQALPESVASSVRWLGISLFRPPPDGRSHVGQFLGRRRTHVCRVHSLLCRRSLCRQCMGSPARQNYGSATSGQAKPPQTGPTGSQRALWLARLWSTAQISKPLGIHCTLGRATSAAAPKTTHRSQPLATRTRRRHGARWWMAIWARLYVEDPSPRPRLRAYCARTSPGQHGTICGPLFLPPGGATGAIPNFLPLTESWYEPRPASPPAEHLSPPMDIGRWRRHVACATYSGLGHPHHWSPK